VAGRSVSAPRSRARPGSILKRSSRSGSGTMRPYEFTLMFESSAPIFARASASTRADSQWLEYTNLTPSFRSAGASSSGSGAAGPDGAGR
jgi:hypothetical protein